MLSIIVVNYNGKQFLGPCLESIRNLVSCEHEVIVVDNASTDGSVEYLKEYEKNIVLIEASVNMGFTGGNNLGAEKAKGDVLFLLNNDTKLLSDLKPAVDILSSTKGIGVVGCNMFYGDGRLQPSMGYEHTPLRMVLSWVGMKRISFLPNIFRRENINVDEYNRYHDSLGWVSGASLVTLASIWQKLGGLDTQYFMYMEDVDFCKRVKEINYNVAYTPEVKLVHYEGAGRAWIGEKALLRTSTSYLVYSKKFHGKIGQLFMRIGVATIFFMRSIAYALLALTDNDKICIEKRNAYFKATSRLISLQLDV